MQFYNFPAHPELTGRLHEALALLRLRCVNRKLWRHCTYVSERSGIVLHEFVCASREVNLPDLRITNLPLYVSYEFTTYEDIRTVFRSVRRHLEEQHEKRDASLRSLEIMLETMCSKNAALKLKIKRDEESNESLEKEIVILNK